jgi:small subunit ribosomal protein S7
MSRRAKPDKRVIIPDARYQSTLISLFVARMMRRGKRSLAVRLMYDAMDIVKDRSGKEPLEVLDQAIKNVGPSVEVKPRRVGGATYQVPMEVPASRRTTLAMRWIIDAATARSGKSFSEKLANEVLDASSNSGTAVKKREETHKMAEANRAFSHYRA